MAKNDPSQSTLKAVPNNLAREQSLDAFDLPDSETCEKCFGSGMEVVPGKGARICECRQRDGQSVRLEKSRVPKRYERCHFTTYDHPLTDSQKRARDISFEFMKRYPAVDQGILLMGPVGVGKTHLAVSIIKGLAERGFSSLFYEFGSLLKEIQDSYNPNTRSSELAVLGPVLRADILVLDELGASKPTDWVRDTMSHIINTRYNDKKFTIFTTNFLDDRPSERDETLEDRIGVRVRSRIFEMCQTIRIDGADYRRRFDRPRR
ncbi:MAG: ATP-binding protein [Pyrinomonadaceae bacterium]